MPDILEAARASARGGADWITVHLRQDRRHIQDEDVYILKNKGPLPLNFEMAAAEEIVAIALNVKPWCACLVPEKRQELTTEGGLDVAGGSAVISSAVRRLKKSGIEVSLFIDPDTEQVRASHESGADAVELHTGAYANAFGEQKKAELARITAGAQEAYSLGLKVNAGHGLDYDNVKAVSAIKEISELNIGYSIVCRAVFTGLETAVREMKSVIS